MKYESYWWGFSFYAETDEEWNALVLMSKASLISRYEDGDLDLDEDEKSLTCGR